MDTPLRERARSRDASWGEELSGVRMARTGAVFCRLGAAFGLLSAPRCRDAEVRRPGPAGARVRGHRRAGHGAVRGTGAAAAPGLPRRGGGGTRAGGLGRLRVGDRVGLRARCPSSGWSLFAFYFFPLRAALAHMALVARWRTRSCCRTGPQRYPAWTAGSPPWARSRWPGWWWPCSATACSKPSGASGRLSSARSPHAAAQPARIRRDLRHRARARPAQPSAAEPGGG